MILLAKKNLKRRIMYPDMNFRNNVQERSHILDLVKRTIESGESNSALIIGPRGSGKTTVSFTRILIDYKKNSFIDFVTACQQCFKRIA